MKNEFILILDDDFTKGGQLEQSISDAGYDCEHVDTLEAAKKLLDTGKVTFCVLDIWLGEQKTSIEFASKIDPILPTLFITQFSKSPNDPHFLKTREKLPHSTYLNRTADNWTDDVIRGITLAKERFQLYVYGRDEEKKQDIPVKDVITFSEYVTNRRLFIKREDILFISSDRNNRFTGNYGEHSLNENLTEEEKDAIKNINNLMTPDNCIIYTKNEKFIFFGSQLGQVGEGLSKWKEIGWNFNRVHNSYIVNMNLLEELVVKGNRRFLKLKNCNFLIPSTKFNNENASDWFPFLSFE